MNNRQPRVPPPPRFVGEDPLGPAQPAGGNESSQPPETQVRQPESHQSRGGRLARFQITGKGTLLGLDRIIGVAAPPGRPGQQLKITRREGLLSVGFRECLQGLVPGVALEGLPARNERLDHGCTPQSLGDLGLAAYPRSKRASTSPPGPPPIILVMSSCSGSQVVREVNQPARSSISQEWSSECH